MKFTTTAVLAFACASALASSIPYEETVYARDLYERSSSEGAFEKRRGRESLSRSFAHAAGSLGGNVASNAVQSAIQQKLNPQQQRRSLERRRGRESLSKSFAHAAGSLGGNIASNAVQSAIQQKLNPQQQRRSLDIRRRRAPSSSGHNMRINGKGVATSFLNGFAQGVQSRGLEEDVLDELD